MMQTQQPDALAEGLKQAVLEAGRVEVESQGAGLNQQETKKGGVSPISGAPTPPGRPKGVRNKLTNLRDAVIEAFDRVGGVDYLVKLANGTQSDRAAFTSLMNKVLPTQINQQVDGGIRLELGWLGGRGVGATAAQIPEARTQVLDLERDSAGGYRIKDPKPAGEGGLAGDDAVVDAQQKGPGDAQGA